MRLGIDHYELLVTSGLVTQWELDEAYEISRRTRSSLVAVLTATFGIDQGDMAREVARAAGLTSVDLDVIATVDPGVLARIDRDVALQHGFAVLGRSGNADDVTVAVTDPLDATLMDALSRAITGSYEVVVATSRQISELLNRCYGADIVQDAAYGLRDTDADNSASRVMTSNQKMFVGAITPALVVFIYGATAISAVVLNFASMILYAAAAIFRVRMVAIATDPARQRFSYTAPPLNGYEDLPTYTILVPMYHEAAVVPRLLASLAKLEYPAHKLDVLLLCESDDAETVEAIRAEQLGPQFRLLIVPEGGPKTKPKACNYGLEFARGDFVVIYDAEDRPDPDQLTRVLAVFSQAGDDLACVQARLAYWNWNQNLLTRWFEIEYTMWFDLILPGLEQVDAPVPLGGTSNHFRMEVMRDLGGWDAFNVTEDADLGLRLHKQGYRTLNIESTTLEEANSQLGNWIRQRSRWMKGHMQTWLVHNRNPRQTIKALGWKAYIAFQLLIGMGVLGALLNPFYWALIIIWAATQSGIISHSFPPIVNYAAALNLVVWNFAFVYASAAGVGRRHKWSLVLYAFISPLYWALLSYATWRGLFQLITRPFYWEKTVHGLDTPGAELRSQPKLKVLRG